MTNPSKQKLALAWQRVDDRLAALQRRHYEKGDVPLYEAALNPPATEQEFKQLELAWQAPVPFELAYSLRRWNGRWIAHDHMISLSPISEHLYMARVTPPGQENDDASYEKVTGPINPIMESRKRYCFGGHELSGTFLYLDYEEPPEGGHLGQVIRIGEDLDVEFVATSFVDFLNLVASAPFNFEDSDFDPLQWHP